MTMFAERTNLQADAGATDEEPGRFGRIVGTAGAVAVVMLVAAGFGLFRYMKTVAAPPDCGTYATAPAAPNAEHRILVAKPPGNTNAAQDDVADFVRSSLAGTTPAKPLIVDIKFVAGDNSITPTNCLASTLIVDANANDKEKALGGSKSAADTVADQRNQAIATIANAAAKATSAIAKPANPAGGLLSTLQIASASAEENPGAKVYVLTAIDTSAPDCLQADRASDPAGPTTTLADLRVRGCVHDAKALGLIAGPLTLAAPTSVRLSGPQRRVTDAVFHAICTYATTTGRCAATS